MHATDRYIFFTCFKHKFDQIIWLTVDAACMQKKSEKFMQINRIKKIFGSGLKNKFQIYFIFFFSFFYRTEIYFFLVLKSANFDVLFSENKTDIYLPSNVILYCGGKMKTFSERDQNEVKSSLNQEKYQSVD